MTRPGPHPPHPKNGGALRDRAPRARAPRASTATSCKGGRHSTLQTPAARHGGGPGTAPGRMLRAARSQQIQRISRPPRRGHRTATHTGKPTTHHRQGGER